MLEYSDRSIESQLSSKEFYQMPKNLKFQN